MCIYLNTANVYIRRIYDTLETILRKMLNLDLQQQIIHTKYLQASDRSARG